MIDNKEILIKQTECLGMMYELKDNIKDMHHTLYSMKGQLSFSEARKYLDVTSMELNELVRNKIIPCIKISKRKLIFGTSDLDEYLETHGKRRKEESHG